MKIGAGKKAMTKIGLQIVVIFFILGILWIAGQGVSQDEGFDPTSQYNQSETLNITGNASTTDQATINNYLNINGDGTTWNVSDIKYYANKPTYYINSTDTLQTQVGTTYKEALSLTWTPEDGSKYLVLAYAEGNNTNTANGTRVQIYNDSLMLAQFIDRPRTAITEIMPYMFAIIQSGAGASVHYNITFSSSSTGTAGILRAKLMAIRIDNLANTHFNSTYINVEQANVNTAWGDVAGDTDEITITPQTDGWYLILATAKVESDSTTNRISYRLNIDNGQEFIPYAIGTLAGDFNYSLIREINTAEELSWGVSAVRYFTSGSTHSIKSQIVTTSGTTADWQYRSLIAIRLTDVFDWLNSSTITQASWSTNTNFQNYTVLSLNNKPGTYLMLGGITIQGSSATYTYSNQLVIDGVSYNLIAERPNVADEYRARIGFQNITLDNGQHYVATQYKTSNTGGTARVKNSDVLALSLDGILNYRSEIEHNATGVSYSGTLNNINISVNFSVNTTSNLNLTIYNFCSGIWNYTPCQGGTVNGNEWNNWWCNITENVACYNSSEGDVRIRLNETVHSSPALIREEYVQYYVSYTPPNFPPSLGDESETPSSPTTYSPGATYSFNITVNNPEGASEISMVLFEWEGQNETVLTYSGFNSTARNYSVTKIDLTAKPAGYSFRWFANDSQNQWGNVVQGTFIINKALSSIAITFSQNPVDYPTESTITCDKNIGESSSILRLYRNTTLITQGTGSSVSDIVTLGAGVYNYSCSCEESENYTASLVLNRYLNVKKGTPNLNLLLNSLASDLEVTYPSQTNATGYESNNGDSDITYKLYRNSSISVSIGEGSNVQDVLTLGATTYYYVYNSTEGANWSTNNLTRILIVGLNTSTINFMNLTINGTESNKIYTYPSGSNATGWYNPNAFVGPVPTFILYRNGTDKGNSNPVSDVAVLPSGFYNYTYFTSGNQNYSSAQKQFNLTIEKASLSPFLHITINGSETDKSYVYENVTNLTGWSTLAGQSGITYNFYRNTTTTSNFINSGTSVSDILRLGVETYYYVFNTTGNENYSSGTITRQLAITKKTPTNSLSILPSSSIIYPTQTTATCTIPSLNSEVTSKLYRNTSQTNPVSSGNPATETIILDAEAHGYVCNNSGTQNYTSTSNSDVLLVSQGNPSSYINLYIDSQTADKTISYPSTAEVRGNVSAIQGASNLIFKLYRGNVVLGYGNSTNQTVDSTKLGNSTYVFVYNTSGNANWTSGSSSTKTLYVLKGVVPLHLAINGTEESENLKYENVTNVTGWSDVTGENLEFKLYRNDEQKSTGSPASDIIRLGVGAYNYVFNTSGGDNYSSNTTSLALTIEAKNINIYLSLNGTEANRTYNYPEAVNATAWKGQTINNEGTVTLLRGGVSRGSGQSVTEQILLGNGTYNYSATFSATNYTALNILSNRFALVNKGIPSIFLAINGTQGNVTYTYPNASNATGWLGTLNNEGSVELWRNGASKGNGDSVTEEILLGYGEYNYSITFAETQNYSYNSITQNRFLKINKATSTAILILSPPSPIVYGTNTTATCSENNPEANGIMWRNDTDVTSQNNTETTLPAGAWHYVCNVSQTENYTSATDSEDYTVEKGSADVRLFLDGLENNRTYTYEDFANITATLNVSGKIFYLEANFSGTNEIINQGTNSLENVTNNFGAGTFNITSYWNGDQNYTGDFQTYFMNVGKKQTTTYLWLNETREDKYYANKSWANLTVELVGYPGKPVELWTNYSNGVWKKWDYGNSPLQNITQLNFTGTFNFTGNYSGNANYSESYESWLVTVSTMTLNSKLESMTPSSINQSQNSTAVGNCSCTGGACNNVYIEIQADENKIPNTAGGNLQVNGSNPYYIGPLSNTWAARSWNITGWEAGSYAISIKCNSSETNDIFSTTQNLNVNDTTKPTWNNNITSPTSPKYSPDQSYQFNITWNDNVDISNVFIEHNFTTGGPLTNSTMSNQSSEYYFDLTDLKAGTYVWRCYANDTSGNENITDQWVYVVNKAPTLTKLFLNGTEGNNNYNVNEYANFTVTLNVSGKTVHLETNITGWSLQSNATPLYNYTRFSQKGVFNITGYFSGDENYTESSQTYFANVLDSTIPTWSNSGQNDSWVGVNKTILLFANWSDNFDLDYAWLSTNETGEWKNKTVMNINLSEGQTWSNFSWRNSSVPAGWTIGWRIYANDSSGNENLTNLMTFIINASELWSYPTGGFIYSSSAVGDVNDDENIDVVFGSYDKNIYALRGSNGTKIWNFISNGSVASSPAITNLTSNTYLDVFVGSYDYNMYAINGSDGSKIWNFSTGGIIFSSPAISDVNKDNFYDIVFGSADYKVYAINGTNGNKVWEYLTEGKVMSSPAISNISVDGYPVVFVGSYDYNMYAINGSDGSKIWNFSTGEKIESSPALEDINNDGFLEVAFGSYDNKMYVLNASDGKEIWNYTAGSWITSSPVIANISNDKKIIVGSHDSNVYAFNADGTINWTFSIPTGGRIPSSPSLADVNLDGINDVIVGASDGRIYALNGNDGKLLWNYNVVVYVFSSPSLSDLNGDGSLDILFGSNNNNQYALDPPSWSLFGANQRRTRIVDTAKPKLLSYGYNINDTHIEVYSSWEEVYSNLAFAKLNENSTGDVKEVRYSLRGMTDWINYTLEKKSILENRKPLEKKRVIEFTIEVFDEHENSEMLSFAVNISMGEADIRPPFWRDEISNPFNPTYEKNREYEFSIFWSDDTLVSLVLFESNFTGFLSNYSVGQSGENFYRFAYKDLAAGTYYYKWYANDSSDNWNSTEGMIYNIKKATTEINLYLNGSDENRAYHFSNIANTTTVTNIGGRAVENWNNLTGIFKKWKEGMEPLQSLIKLNYSPGLYNFSGVFGGDGNYTEGYDSHAVSIFGYSEVSRITVINFIVKTNSSVTIKCFVNDANTSLPIRSYPVDFYIDNLLLGTNTTDSKGLSSFTFKASEKGWHEVKCAIKSQPSLFYDVTSNSFRKILIAVFDFFWLFGVVR